MDKLLSSWIEVGSIDVSTGGPEEGLGMSQASTLHSNGTLMSISIDGSVLEWTTKKGFAVKTPMQLKRTL
jgi:hypothetical protein